MAAIRWNLQINRSAHTRTMNDNGDQRSRPSRQRLLAKALKWPYLSTEWIGRTGQKSSPGNSPFPRRQSPHVPRVRHCATNNSTPTNTAPLRQGCTGAGPVFICPSKPAAWLSAWATTPVAGEASRASISTAWAWCLLSARGPSTAGPKQPDPIRMWPVYRQLVGRLRKQNELQRQWQVRGANEWSVVDIRWYTGSWAYFKPCFIRLVCSRTRSSH